MFNIDFENHFADVYCTTYLGTEPMVLEQCIFQSFHFYLNPDVGVCFRLAGQATDLQISDSTNQKQNLQGHMLQF